jgi:hypothetical protein
LSAIPRLLRCMAGVTRPKLLSRAL